MVTRRSLLAAAVAAACLACGAEKKPAVPTASGPPPEGLVKEPNVAGTFYPAARDELAALVRARLGAAQPSLDAAAVVAIFTPHAGYEYSGGVAAAAFKQLQGRRPTTVVLLGPSHYMAAPEIAAPTYDGFATPLGTVPVDNALIAAVESTCAAVRRDNAPFAREHCLEVQMPFIQIMFPDARLAPFIFCYHDAAAAERFGRSLATATRARREDIVIVATCDLSHYHPYDEAVKLDRSFVRAFEKFDAAAVVAGAEGGAFEIDAPGVIVAALVAGRELGATAAKTLDNRNSGDVTGEKGAGVVGYFAGALVK